MKKQFTILLIITSFIINAQSYNGNVYYQKDGWDGITANCNVSVIGTTSQNGVYFESLLVDLDIKTLTIAQKVIPENQIPSTVKYKIKTDARIRLDFDIYVNNVFIMSSGSEKPSISWARLQGLPDSDGYKPAVKENGYKLYHSRAISVRNVKVNNLTYRVDQVYYEKIRKDIAGVKNNTSSNQTNNNSGSTEVLINGQSSSNSSTSSESDKVVDKKEESSSTSDYSNYIPPKTKEQQINELAQNGGQILNNIAADIEANRLQKEAKERRDAERRAKNRSYGNQLINENSSKAIKYGDENAIEMTYKGYMNVNAESTEEGNDKEAIAFLEKMHLNFKSDFAKKQLIEDYSRTINFYDKERKKRTRRAFIHSGIGAALIAGSLSDLGDELMSDEMLGADTGPIVLTVVTVFGGYMVLSGVVNSFLISDYGKSRTEYKEAKGRIESLNNQNVKISLSTEYNKRSNNLMVGLVIGF
jgi:hypothetical protein